MGLELRMTVWLMSVYELFGARPHGWTDERTALDGSSDSLGSRNASVWEAD